MVNIVLSEPIKCQCCPNSQLICCANQLTSFYMRATLAFNGLNNKVDKTLRKTGKYRVKDFIFNWGSWNQSVWTHIHEAPWFVNFDLEIMHNIYPRMHFSLNSWSIPFVFKYLPFYLALNSLTERQSHFTVSFLSHFTKVKACLKKEGRLGENDLQCKM